MEKNISPGSDWYLWKVWHGGLSKLIAVNGKIQGVPDAEDAKRIFDNPDDIECIGKVDLIKIV